VTRWEVYPCNGVLHRCNRGKTVLGPRRNGFAVGKMLVLTNLVNTGAYTYGFIIKKAQVLLMLHQFHNGETGYWLHMVFNETSQRERTFQSPVEKRVVQETQRKLQLCL